MGNHPLMLWNRFCERFAVMETGTDLFAVNQDGSVRVRELGQTNRRNLLCRSEGMEALIRRETARLMEDYYRREGIYDGLLYMMYTENGGSILPLYIGKSETFGKNEKNLSANLQGIGRDTSKFARWGDNYAYHIGDLSAVVLPAHDPKYKQPKYISWAETLFSDFPAEQPQLKIPVKFWTIAWKNSDTGIWEELGPVRLTFLEYLLIGVASAAFGDILLNREGRNRN
ncbi:MAG: hypothetical protein IT279_08125 [Ignavibacteriaceae bacterium]|nr:hypothetical protein [Ignavibacteriaceae bacterium]